MTQGALYLTEADVGDLVDLNTAIDALSDGLKRQGEGAALDIPKALGAVGPSAFLHALGSALPQDGWGGFKTWINTPVGAQAVMEVFDTRQGRLAAIIEAGLLGQLRTAAVSGVATRLLAAPDADDFTLVGTGRQAMMQLASVAIVRPLKRVRIFSPTPERRAAFVEEARRLFDLTIEDSPSLETALEGASIVTLVTRATEVFAHAALFAPGAHINAVGAILPANAEIAQDVFDRSGAVVVDSLAGVQRNSREFIDRFGSSSEGWGAVQPLSDLLASGFERPVDGRFTLFKAMGMGLSDLSVATVVIARAVSQNRGFRLPTSALPSPRWTLPSSAAL